MKKVSSLVDSSSEIRSRTFFMVAALSMSCLLACGNDSENLVRNDGGADDASSEDARSNDTQPDGAPSEVDLGGQIGVVGCSNTRQAVQGYLAVSSQDRLINSAQNGLAMTQWSQISGGPWDEYEALRPNEGYTAVWINLCQRASHGLTQETVNSVISNVRSRDASALIVLSPLNFYENEMCTITEGNTISNAGGLIADALAQGDETILRGPDLGPFDQAEIDDDLCHLSDSGIAAAGQQLSTYFDL